MARSYAGSRVVVRVVPETRVPPPGVDCRVHMLFPPPAAEFFAHVRVVDLCPFEPLTHGLPCELRAPARTGVGPDIDQNIDALRVEQAGEIRSRTFPMSNGPNFAHHAIVLQEVPSTSRNPLRASAAGHGQGDGRPLRYSTFDHVESLWCVSDLDRLRRWASRVRARTTASGRVGGRRRPCPCGRQVLRACLMEGESR
jgi:hypothetical protein